MNIHQISAEHLTIERIGEIVRGHEKLALSDDARQRIVRCRTYLDEKIANQTEPVYGVTTGFGSLCKVSVSKDELSQLQVNLIKSHACGVGPRVENDIVRIMLLLKIQSLSYGYSGCKLDTVERLIDFFNHDIVPVVYRQGSLGASGDLVPLAHLCLPLVGEGEVEMQGEVISGAEMLQKMGWKPIEMASKEGLALLNGTQNMSAYAVWSLLEAQRLSDWADVIAAMSLDAFDGRIEPFTHAVHAVRPHLGQIETARRFRELLDGSELIQGQKVHVQDPYSFRCVPQVHGAVKDTLRYVKSVIDIEINSATDNPIVRP
ncbi:MAG: aromatic amino acid lyase, partial [Prevotella sp.]|nr:aromatic amino acid lyase [Prevotella sp.]